MSRAPAGSTRPPRGRPGVGPRPRCRRPSARRPARPRHRPVPPRATGVRVPAWRRCHVRTRAMPKQQRSLSTARYRPAIAPIRDASFVATCRPAPVGNRNRSADAQSGRLRTDDSTRALSTSPEWRGAHAAIEWAEGAFSGLTPARFNASSCTSLSLPPATAAWLRAACLVLRCSGSPISRNTRPR